MATPERTKRDSADERKARAETLAQMQKDRSLVEEAHGRLDRGEPLDDAHLDAAKAMLRRAGWLPIDAKKRGPRQ